MNCKIILTVGTKDGVKDIVLLESGSLLDLDSYEAVSEIIRNFIESKSRRDRDLLLQTILKSRTISEINIKKVYLGIDINTKKKYSIHNVANNCSFQLLCNLYPKEMELIKDIGKDYNIIYTYDYIKNGKILKGRIVEDGMVKYVLRNKWDIENFALTEYKKKMVEDIVQGDDIIEDKLEKNYLSDKYRDKLLAIKEQYKERLQKLKEEEEFKSDETTFTIKHMLLDYLHHKNQYNKLIKIGDKYVNSKVILNDFIRELNHLEISLEDTETDLAAHLRSLNWNRESFGKREMYLALSKFFPDFVKDYSKDKFLNLNLELMSALLKSYFEEDIIMQDYEVVSVGSTEEEEFQLSDAQVTKLFKQVLELKNKDLESLNNPKITSSLELLIGNYKDAVNFFSGYLSGKFREKELTLYIKEGIKDGEYVIYYRDKKLSDTDTITLKRNRRTLRDLFNVGYDTMDVFNAVNDEDVIDGYYNGFYIYEHVSNTTSTYIVSRSILFPDAFDPPKYSSLRDAKMAVNGMNRFANIEKATNIGIKNNMASEKGLGHITSLVPMNEGLTIESIYYPIKSTTNLPTAEAYLIKNSKMHEVIAKYKEYGIDLSVFTLPELFGTFIYAMAENKLTFNYGLKELKQDLDENLNIKEEILNAINREFTEEELRLLDSSEKNLVLRIKSWKTINEIISKIKSAHTHLYVVKRSIYDKKAEVYNIYLGSLTDSDILVGALGLITKSSNLDLLGKAPAYTLTKALYSMKSAVENSILKDTGIGIKIVSLEDIKELEIFEEEDISGVRAFLHGNNIYINLNKADLNDLSHEILHIILLAIRAKDILNLLEGNATNYYEQIVLHFGTHKVSKTMRDRVDELYKNLSEIDKLEELTVRKLSYLIENNPYFYLGNFEREDGSSIEEMLINLFGTTKAEIKDAINSAGIGMETEAGFGKNVRKLIIDLKNQMLTGRQVTNLIKMYKEMGKDNFKEICE